MKAALYFLIYISYLSIGAVYTVNFNKDIDSTMGSYILLIFIWPIYMIRSIIMRWQKWSHCRIDNRMKKINLTNWRVDENGNLRSIQRPVIKIK